MCRTWTKGPTTRHEYAQRRIDQCLFLLRTLFCMFSTLRICRILVSLCVFYSVGLMQVDLTGSSIQSRRNYTPLGVKLGRQHYSLAGEHTVWLSKNRSTITWRVTLFIARTESKQRVSPVRWRHSHSSLAWSRHEDAWLINNHLRPSGKDTRQIRRTKEQTCLGLD
jgi:hypothetical protein